jgi:hypothetical protein
VRFTIPPHAISPETPDNVALCQNSSWKIAGFVVTLSLAKDNFRMQGLKDCLAPVDFVSAKTGHVLLIRQRFT